MNDIQEKEDTCLSEEDDDARDDSEEDDDARDDSEEDDDARDDSEEDDDARDDSDEDDAIYKVSWRKKDEPSLFSGKHETLVSEGGEADLHRHLVGCKKNPGHTQFIPVNEFNINCLPEGHHDNDLVELIKATADLTVRIGVKMTSAERPEFWPNSKEPYAFYDIRESEVLRIGTGMVWCVNKYIGTCECQKCLYSNTPSKVWGQVLMSTATHVVFDDIEARHTMCRLFFDRQNSPLVTLDGWTMYDANIRDDRCDMKCATCDVDLLDKLDMMVRHWWYLCDKVDNKYKSTRDEDKLTLMVSHPHGCPKQVSVGHWINRCVKGDIWTKYTYTTCTCPGSSGANVYSLGFNDYMYYVSHVHSGVNSEGINYSGTGRDWR